MIRDKQCYHIITYKHETVLDLLRSKPFAWPWPSLGKLGNKDGKVNLKNKITRFSSKVGPVSTY